MKGPKIGSELYMGCEYMLQQSDLNILNVLVCIGKKGIRQLLRQQHLSINVTINPSLQQYMDIQKESMKDITNFIYELRQGHEWEFLDFGILNTPKVLIPDYKVEIGIKYSIPIGLELMIPIYYISSGSGTAYIAKAGKGNTLYCDTSIVSQDSSYSKYGKLFNRNIRTLFSVECNILNIANKNFDHKIKVNNELFYRFHLRNIYSYMKILYKDLTLNNLLEYVTVLIAADSELVRRTAGELLNNKVQYKKAIDSQIIRDHFKE